MKEDVIRDVDKNDIESFARNLGRSFSKRVLEYYLDLIQLIAQEENKK